MILVKSRQAYSRSLHVLNILILISSHPFHSREEIESITLVITLKELLLSCRAMVNFLGTCSPAQWLFVE